MQYPDDLMKIAKRIVAIAPEIPVRGDGVDPITDYEDPKRPAASLPLSASAVSGRSQCRDAMN
jgi:hypothetical protein